MEIKKISMANIGQKLREAREKKSLSIDQAEKQTHIHSTVIAALEEGRCDEILTSMYVKSFLKKYALFLGLDSRQIMNEYAIQHPELRAQNVSVPAEDPSPSPSPKHGVDFSKYIDILRYILIAFVVLFVMVFFIKKAALYYKGIKNAKPIQALKHKDGTEKAAVHKKSSHKKIEAAQAQPIKDESLEVKTPAKIVIPKKEQILLELKTTRAVLVEIKKDGVLLFKRVLPKGTTESFTADESIDIYVAKAEAIDLTLNGRALGSPGRGLIKDLEITRKGVRVK